MTRRWAAAALAGIAAYVAIDLALWRLDPWYSLIRNAESDYGVGAPAWLMDLNFVLRGAFSLVVTLVLLRRLPAGNAGRIGSYLIIVWAAFSAALALFPDMPLSTGRVHAVLAAVAFVAVALGTLMVSYELRAQKGQGSTPLPALAFLGALALLAALAGYRSHAFGLLERVFLGLELVWLAVAMALTVRSTGSGLASDPTSKENLFS